MRKNRKAEENFFVQKFMQYCRTEIDKNVSEISEVTDKPDLAISSFGRVIGVEFSQFPSKYIIENFHKKRPTPNYTKNRIEGSLTIYPFEPHRWVHEVLDKKRKKVAVNKNRIHADEMWLVMHCHSITKEWPMSDRSSVGSREAEALLMRFGTKQYRSSFERIFYIYADGTIVALSGESVVVPTAVTIPDAIGYPAVTSHQFSFSFEVPLPGLGIHEYQFDDIEFTEKIIAPIDDWMANCIPDIERPKINATVQVNADKMVWKIFRNGVLIADNVTATGDWIGTTMYKHLILDWSVKATTFDWVRKNDFELNLGGITFKFKS